MSCTAVRTLATPLFRVEEHVLARGYAMGRHTHCRAGVVVGLAGAWVGEIRRDELACGPGEVIVLPDGAAHRERAPAGGRCLLVSLAGDLEPATLRRHRRVAATSLSLAVAAALRTGDGSAIEDAMVRLLDALAPPARVDGGRWVGALREALDAGFLDEPDVASLAVAAGRSR